jgi:O-antigen/teichoic acid export membrane protein
MFPTMASVQDDKNKLAKMLRSAETMGAYVVIPVMFGLAAVSEAFIDLLLTDKWLPCVPYMQWLCIANAAVPITSSNLIAIKSTGRSDIYMRLEMIRRVVMLVILIISVVVFRSVLAIAVSFCISSWLDALITMTPVKRLIGYGIKGQLADLWKIFLASGVMFVSVQAMNLLQWSGYLLLPLQILTGAALYLLLGMLLRIEPQAAILTMLRKMLRKK